MVDLIGNRTLPGLLAEHAELRPGKVALVFEDDRRGLRTYTYGELFDAVRRLAAGFAGLGLGPGDKAVVHLPNCPEIVLSFFALAHLGAVAVPANTASTAPELSQIAHRSDARIVVTSSDHVPLIEAVAGRTPGLERVVVTGAHVPGGHVGFSELLAASTSGRDSVAVSESPVEIIFTSGTTALPKGVVLTHANWLWSGERSSRTLRLDERDRLLSALPLFHVNAQSITLMNALTLGATAIILERFSAGRFMAQVRRHSATHTSIVAMLLRTLLAQPEHPDDARHELRRVSYAINVTDTEKDQFERRFGVELINGYGLSEAMTEVTVCPVGGPKRWPSIGLPALDREVGIGDAEGNQLEAGQIGEILVRGVPGRTIMQGYYKDPEATARTIVDGWLHTGDNGYLDPLGYLYFVDRAKDIIKRAGENVSASEVERVLIDHPGIAQAAVIAVPDPIRDEAVKAFVVLAAGVTLTDDEVRAHCAARLARFKVPGIVEFRDALPMTSIGKIEKRRLREEAGVS